MKLIVAGGRDYRLTGHDRRLLAVLLRQLGATKVLHGDCRGVDRDAAQVAREQGVEPEPHAAHWRRYGKAAGPMRNGAMVAMADGLIAFPGGSGTADVTKKAAAKGLPVWEVA